MTFLSWDSSEVAIGKVSNFSKLFSIFEPRLLQIHRPDFVSQQLNRPLSTWWRLLIHVNIFVFLLSLRKLTRRKRRKNQSVFAFYSVFSNLFFIKISDDKSSTKALIAILSRTESLKTPIIGLVSRIWIPNGHSNVDLVLVTFCIKHQTHIYPKVPAWSFQSGGGGQQTNFWFQSIIRGKWFLCYRLEHFFWGSRTFKKLNWSFNYSSILKTMHLRNDRSDFNKFYFETFIFLSVEGHFQKQCFDASS